MSSGRRRTIRSSLIAAVLSIAAAAMVFQSVAGIGLFGALLVRTAVQTTGIKVQEREDRAAVNARRDGRRAAIAAEEAGLAVKLQRGWLTPEQVERERARLAEFREAVDQVALRERQIVSYQARRRIDQKLRDTFRDAIAAATGADARAVDFVTAIVRGENPLEAAIAAAVSEPSADPRQGFRDLRDRLREVRAAAEAVGGAQTIAVRARIAEALREAAGLAEGDGPPPDDQIERLRELSDALGRAAEQLGEVTDELLPDSPGIARDRFDHDERWVVWSERVRALDASDAKQALTSSILRRSSDRILDIAAAAGRTLSEEQVAAIAADVFSAWIEQRVASGFEAGDVIDLDGLARDTINETLLANGLDPLPEPATADEPPLRRAFTGEGTFAHDYRDRSDGSCAIELIVAFELTLQPDGTATLFIGDTPKHEGSGGDLVCLANGAPQLYSGAWTVGSGSDVTATFAFGSTEEAIEATIGGQMPDGLARTDSDIRYYGEMGGFVVAFELAEVQP